MENILDQLPENIKQMVLINALHDGQEIQVSDYSGNSWKKEANLWDFEEKFKIIHNYDKPIEEIKAGDVVEVPSNEGLFVVVAKDKGGFVLMYGIHKQDYTIWLPLEGIKYHKPKTELEEAIEWLERIKKTTHGESSKHSEIILKELNKCTK